MEEWYVGKDGQQHGPMDRTQAQAYARANPDAYCWRDGMANWAPVTAVPELAPPAATPAAPGGFGQPAASGPFGQVGGALGGLAQMAGGLFGGQQQPQPQPGGYPQQGYGQAQPGYGQAQPSYGQPQAGYPQAGYAQPGPADVFEHQICGSDMQYVEIALDPGEAVVAEAGAMFYKDAWVQMETIFGDGSAQQAAAGVMGKLMGAGKRLLTGESLFTTVFTNSNPQAKSRVAFGAPFPGTISAINLRDVGGRLICQKDSFLAAARGVQIGIAFQRKILTGLFGGEGFIMQKLEGDGIAFIHMGGTTCVRDLAPGEVLHIDTGCVAAYTDTVDFDVVAAGGVKTMLFGGEGAFFATLRGPGRVWMQSLPFSRLAGRMLAAAPQLGGSSEEGSVLGPFGRILSGDR